MLVEKEATKFDELFFSFLRSRGGSFRARTTSAAAEGTTETVALRFCTVSLTVTFRPFQSAVPLAISSPTFLGDWKWSFERKMKQDIPDQEDQSWGQERKLHQPHHQRSGASLREVKPKYSLKKHTDDSLIRIELGRHIGVTERMLSLRSHRKVTLQPINAMVPYVKRPRAALDRFLSGQTGFN